MSQKAAHVHISGRVQGIGFRWQTRLRAKELKIEGWIRNNPDGTVEAFIQGNEEAIIHMIQWFKDGPPGAKVEALDLSWQKPNPKIKGFNIF